MAETYNGNDLDRLADLSDRLTAKNISTKTFVSKMADLGGMASAGSEIDKSKNYQESMYNNDFLLSYSKAKARYEDSSNTLFIEDWTNLSSWSTSAGVQVSNNKLYSTGTEGGASGINHAYPLSSTEKARIVFNFNFSSTTTSGGVIFGVSTDAAGATPSNAGGNAFGIYAAANYVKQIVDGSITDLNVPRASKISGNFIGVVTIDLNYISVVLTNVNDTSEEYAMRTLRPTGINNIYIFNSDTQGLNGSYCSKIGARKSFETIYPRTDLEGEAKTIQWTGDGTQSFKIYLPKEYDSRIPTPAIICFHGLGTSEKEWSTNGNMSSIQKHLTSNGYIVLSCGYNNSTSTWGNSLSTNAYYKAYKYLVDNYSISNIGIYANSMGGIESLNAIAIEQIPCSCWVGTAPSANLNDIYNTEMFVSGVKSAYGILSDGSNYDEQTKGRDPYLNSNFAFRGIPMLFISADDDAAVDTANNTDLFLAKIKPTSIYAERITVPNGVGGHSFSVSSYLTNILNMFNKYVSNRY